MKRDFERVSPFWINKKFKNTTVFDIAARCTAWYFFIFYIILFFRTTAIGLSRVFPWNGKHKRTPWKSRRRIFFWGSHLVSLRRHRFAWESNPWLPHYICDSLILISNKITWTFVIILSNIINVKICLFTCLLRSLN